MLRRCTPNIKHTPSLLGTLGSREKALMCTLKWPQILSLQTTSSSHYRCLTGGPRGFPVAEALKRTLFQEGLSSISVISRMSQNKKLCHQTVFLEDNAWIEFVKIWTDHGRLILDILWYWISPSGQLLGWNFLHCVVTVRFPDEVDKNQEMIFISVVTAPGIERRIFIIWFPLMNELWHS